MVLCRYKPFVLILFFFVKSPRLCLLFLLCFLLPTLVARDPVFCGPQEGEKNSRKKRPQNKTPSGEMVDTKILTGYACKNATASQYPISTTPKENLKVKNLKVKNRRDASG